MIARLRHIYHRLTRPAPYSIEKALLAGTHRTASRQPSILHFSLNKAATQYTKNILRAIAAENNLTPVGMNEWAFGSTQPYLDHLSALQMEQYKHVFRPAGYLYSVFGGMVENIDNLAAYKILLMVRNPRDILVSSYFSAAFSHPLPGEKSDKRAAFLERREHAKSIGIDAFTLEEAPRLLANLQRYQQWLLTPCPHVLVLRNEDMILDFKAWLSEIVAYTGCSISEKLETGLVEKHMAAKPLREDKMRHLRKGVAGDFLEKLKPATIGQLDALFAPIEHRFGY